MSHPSDLTVARVTVCVRVTFTCASSLTFYYTACYLELLPNHRLMLPLPLHDKRRCNVSSAEKMLCYARHLVPQEEGSERR